MKIPSIALRKRCATIVCAVLMAFACSAFNYALGATSPTLISTSSNTRAIALESVTMRTEPFTLSSEGFFNANDPRTRIELFCMNLDLLNGEGASALTADAEDAAHLHYPLTVEYVGQVPPLLDAQGNITNDFRGIYMVIVRL